MNKLLIVLLFSLSNYVSAEYYKPDHSKVKSIGEFCEAGIKECQSFISQLCAHMNSECVGLYLIHNNKTELIPYAIFVREAGCLSVAKEMSKVYANASYYCK